MVAGTGTRGGERDDGGQSAGSALWPVAAQQSVNDDQSPRTRPGWKCTVLSRDGRGRGIAELGGHRSSLLTAFPGRMIEWASAHRAAARSATRIRNPANPFRGRIASANTDPSVLLRAQLNSPILGRLTRRVAFGWLLTGGVEELVALVGRLRSRASLADEFKPG